VSPTPQQLRQWSEEVAADPGSPAFLPLARHYREAGRHDAALRLVLRGLERHPNDVEAHHLLGLLYLEGGEEVKAFDEWDIALALAPEHHGSRRQMAFLCHARGEVEAAERHLEKALEGDFEDREVRRLLEEIYAAKREARGPRRRPSSAELAPAAAPIVQDAPVATPVVAPVAATAPPAAAPSPAPGPVEGTSSGGASAYDVLQGELRAVGAERGMIGAVLLDPQGYVVAGEMAVEGRDRGPEIAAVLSPASSEAERAVRHLGLGGWKGILVETPDAVIRLTPTADGGMMAVAGRRDVPMGWVLRVAARARDAAARFVAAAGGGGT
jgi:predicted regulator of Ras-like GTPase activity (Roadblock/LC7/MglB family)